MGENQIKATDKKLDKEFLDRIVGIRRDLHQHPELSWQEHKTQQKIITWLGELGVHNFREVAGTGLIVDIERIRVK